jgi:predicted S18 family serine protease
MAEMFKIENPASNIYNPADRMNDPNPLSPPTQPVPQPTAPKEATTTTPPPPEQVREQRAPEQERAVPYKRSSFTTAKAYLAAADKAYNKGDYRRFLSMSEEALSRIRTGTLTASKKAKQKLVRNRALGRKLLEKGSR